MKGRNKLVPRLLGITRESVMRVDESTKEVCTFFCRYVPCGTLGSSIYDLLLQTVVKYQGFMGDLCPMLCLC